MRKFIFPLVTLAVLIPGYLWMSYKEDEQIKSLLLHQPVDLNEVHIARLFTGEGEKSLKDEELRNVIEWFNDYPADRVTEQSFDYTASNSGVEVTVSIELNSHYEIKIFLNDEDRIYVSRNDIKGGMMISYLLLDEAEKLMDYLQGKTL